MQLLRLYLCQYRQCGCGYGWCGWCGWCGLQGAGAEQVVYVADLRHRWTVAVGHDHFSGRHWSPASSPAVYTCKHDIELEESIEVCGDQWVRLRERAPAAAAAAVPGDDRTMLIDISKAPGQTANEIPEREPVRGILRCPARSGRIRPSPDICAECVPALGRGHMVW